MANITLKDAFAKLNSLAYRCAESAAIFCKTRGNPSVEIEHFIHQVLVLQDTDLHHIIRHSTSMRGKLAADLQAALEKLPRGSTAAHGFLRRFRRRRSARRGSTPR